MSNPKVPAVPVKIGDKKYKLIFTETTLMQLEERQGDTFKELLEKQQRGSFGAHIKLVWACLFHLGDDCPELEHLAETIGIKGLKDIAPKLGEAMAHVLGGPDQDEDSEDPTDAPNTDD